MGCASSSNLSIIPTEKCPLIEKDGNYKTFGEVMTKLTEVIGMYGDCAAHNNAYVKEK